MVALSNANNNVTTGSSQELMTTKQLARVLGVPKRIIQSHAKLMGLTKNGVSTFFFTDTLWQESCCIFRSADELPHLPLIFNFSYKEKTFF